MSANNSSGPDPPRGDMLLFADCGGLEEQVNYLKIAVLDSLEKGNVQSLQSRFGLPAPKGILFYGPPGTGKTRLAQALGNELAGKLKKKVNFIYRKGQDVASMWFGQSSAKLRAIFEEAKSNKPCVIFFDELDGMCPSRENRFVSQASTSIVTTMLGLMDELPVGEVFVIGATNRLNAIDPALRRPGRFDKHIEFHLPNKKGRENILRIHVKGWKIQPSSELVQLCSEKTAGYSGADLKKLCLDAFDSAIAREMKTQQSSAGDNFDLAKLDLSNLNVLQADWEVALQRMRPSNQPSAFGSAVYTPSNRAENNEYLRSLIKDDIQQVESKLKNLLSRKSASGQPIIQRFYMWSASETDLADYDELILDPVLQTSELEKYPVYVISTETLACSHPRNWSTAVSNTIDQVISQGSKAILYVKCMGEVSYMIEGHKIALQVDMGGQLERLRGTSVLVLLSGSQRPDRVPANNVFKTVLNQLTENENHEVGSLPRTAREQFFRQTFHDCLFLAMKHEWYARDMEQLEEAIGRALESTDCKDLSSITILHDRLVRRMAKDCSDEKAGVEQILLGIWEEIGTYTNLAI